MTSDKRLIIGLAALLCLAGCEKKRSEAIVVGKEFIAAASTSASPEQHPKARRVAGADEEIVVDSYTMKRSVRGTGLDPRAQKQEQYLLKVRTSADGRTFNVPTDQSRFAKLKLGARVIVEYQTGKYTGSIWAAQIVD